MMRNVQKIFVPKTGACHLKMRHWQNHQSSVNKEFADVMVYFRFFQAMTYVPRKPMTVLDKTHFTSFQ